MYTGKGKVYLIPIPVFVVRDAQRSLVFLQRRFNHNDVKLALKITEVKRLKVTLQIPSHNTHSVATGCSKRSSMRQIPPSFFHQFLFSRGLFPDNLGIPWLILVSRLSRKSSTLVLSTTPALTFPAAQHHRPFTDTN